MWVIRDWKELGMHKSKEAKGTVNLNEVINAKYDPKHQKKKCH